MVYGLRTTLPLYVVTVCQLSAELPALWASLAEQIVSYVDFYFLHARMRHVQLIQTSIRTQAALAQASLRFSDICEPYVTRLALTPTQPTHQSNQTQIKSLRYIGASIYASVKVRVRNAFKFEA